MKNTNFPNEIEQKDSSLPPLKQTSLNVNQNFQTIEPNYLIRVNPEPSLRIHELPNNRLTPLQTQSSGLNPSELRKQQNILPSIKKNSSNQEAIRKSKCTKIIIALVITTILLISAIVGTTLGIILTKSKYIY